MLDAALDHCPTMGSPYLFSDDLKDGYRTIFKARCKLWTCPYCAQVNKFQHWIRIKNGLEKLENQGISFNFVTLTSHESLRSFDACYRVWQKSWKKLRQRIVRHQQNDGISDFYYVYIPETHKDGRMHIHGLFSGNIRSRWYKDNARQCGLGYQAKSVKIDDSTQGTNYCLKYVTKTMGEKIDIKHFRRINYSQNFPAKPTASTLGTWTIATPKQSLVSLIESAWQADMSVMMHGKEILEIIEE